MKTAFGLSDSGTLLKALEDHYRYTRDKAWLARAAGTIVRVCNWSIARRAKEKQGQAPGSANFGLIKYQPSGDYPEPDYSFLSDTALCVGLEAAARCLGIVGRQSDASRIAAEAADYRPMHGRSKILDLADGTHTRVKIDLFPEYIRHLQPEKRAVWDVVGRALRAAAVQDAFVRRLAPALKRRFGPHYASVGRKQWARPAGPEGKQPTRIEGREVNQPGIFECLFRSRHARCH